MDKLTIGLFQIEFQDHPYFLEQRIALLDPRRFRVLLIYAETPETVPDPAERLGMPCHFLQGESDKARARQLKAICQREGIDILHCNRHETINIGLRASGFGRRPRVIANFHGMKNVRTPARKIYYRALHRRIAAFVGVTDAARDSLAASLPYVPAAKVVAIHNSIDFDRYARAGGERQRLRGELGVGEDFVFIAIGRMVPAKAYDVMLEAFARVLQQAPDCHLLIVGEGRNRAEVEAGLADPRLHGRARLLGHRDDVAELLHASDAFVHSAIREAFGLVVAEAMAAALPVVVVNIGGPGEIVQSGRYGLLAKPSDAGDLSEKMLELIRMSPEDRGEMAQNARQRVAELFSHRAMVQELERLYRSIAASA